MLKISSNKVIRVGCALNWMFLLSNKSSNCCSPKIRDHLFFHVVETVDCGGEKGFFLTVWSRGC